MNAQAKNHESIFTKELSDMTKQILTMLEIGAIVVLAVWTVAFLRADVNRVSEKVEQVELEVEKLDSEVRILNVNQAVTGEQYEQIINKLDELQLDIKSLEKKGG